MNKFLVLLLCAALGAGVLTMTSMASQRNAWQEEAEKLEKQMKKAESTHEKEMTEMEEALLSAQLERDAYALLQQTTEEEKAALSLRVMELEDMIAEKNAELEAALSLEGQLLQAHADKEWAEQRLQEALAVLMTPAPSRTPAPAQTPAPAGEESLFSAMVGVLQPLAEEHLTGIIQETAGIQATATPAPVEEAEEEMEETLQPQE